MECIIFYVQIRTIFKIKMNYIVQQYYYYNNNKQIIKCLQESVILRKIKTLISDLEWKFTKKLF